MPNARQPGDDGSLRFLDFDADDLAWSVVCLTSAADAAGSLDRSRMTTLCTRWGRMPTRRASILKVTRALSSLSSHSSRTVRPSTSTRMPFWYSVLQCSASRCQSSTGAQ